MSIIVLIMRGHDLHQDAMFSYLSPEQRVPQDHPLRPIRRMTDQALQRLSPRFERMYADIGRPSIAPEKLLRALLLQVLYTIRSERMLLEQLDYNLLFRWFVGLNMDDAVWVPTVFSKNRDRLLEGAVAEAFFDEVLREAGEQELLSEEHFTVDGTLLEAWASQKSFQRKDAPEGPPAGGSGQSHGGLPQREADQRNAPVDDRPGRSAGPEGQRQGGQAELRRARADGEPQRAGGECAADPGHRHRRAGSGRGDGGRHSGPEAGDGGCRQELRRRSDGAAVAGTEGHAARGAEPGTAAQCHRQPEPHGTRVTRSARERGRRWKRVSDG